MIHEGTLQDRPHFMRLYFEFMKAHHERGSYFLPTIHNLNLAKAMFEKFATGVEEGFTLFWTPQDSTEPVAFIMASDFQDSDWDVSLGKFATLWATYVQLPYRNQGIAIKLFARAREIGLGWGVESVLTHVLAGNTPADYVSRAFGTRPALIEHYVDLKGAMSSPESLESLIKETT